MAPESMKHLRQALSNPDSVFSDPEEVLNHPDLEHQQKVQVLSQWRDDQIQLQRAEGEGMAGKGKPALIERISSALQKLVDSRESQARDQKET